MNSLIAGIHGAPEEAEREQPSVERGDFCLWLNSFAIVITSSCRGRLNQDHKIGLLPYIIKSLIVCILSIWRYVEL